MYVFSNSYPLDLSKNFDNKLFSTFGKKNSAFATKTTIKAVTFLSLAMFTQLTIHSYQCAAVEDLF